MRHSIRRAAATAAAGGAVTAIVGLSGNAPAAATTVVPEGAEQYVRVELHSLEPAAPEQGDEVEIIGSITNVTAEPLDNVQALLRYDGTPLTSRSDISRVMTETDVHWGWRPGHIYDIARDELAPGESARFDLKFIVDTTCAFAATVSPPCLRLPAGGVYAIGADVNVTTPEGERHTGGTTRTVLPWHVGDAEPIPVALLWPVVDTPEIGKGALDIVHDGSDPAATPSPGESPGPRGSPEDDAAPGGTTAAEGRRAADHPPRLDRLLTAAGDAPVSWAVDPDAWSPAVSEAVGSTGELIVLPQSVPDVGALARIDPGLAGTVAAAAGRWQREITPKDAPMPDYTDAAWPGAGAVTAQALQAWADAGYDTVVLPGNAVTTAGRTPTAVLEAGGKRLSAILTDPGLDAAIADSIETGQRSAKSAALDLRQRWLAETVLAIDDPLHPPALVAAPPAGWRPSPQVAEAVLDVWTETDWITPTGISGVAAAVPPRRHTAPAAALSPLSAGTDDLPGDYLREVRDLHDELARYHSLIDVDGLSAEPDTGSSATATPSAEPQPTASSGSADEAGDGTGRAVTPALTAARAASVAWHNDLDTAADEVAALRREVAGALAGVNVVVNPSNTLSGNTGVFPVNIANHLTHTVTVRLEFDPANEDRLAIEPVEIRVPGGQQQTVQVRAEAVANGEVPVSVQLATVDGVPLGGAQQTIVNATDYGTIGWFVVGGSAVLFAGGLSWRMLLGRRRSEQ